jgi:guanosine-3',5'-bis(diphosphate) 3'-pyrophosphohydrolase
MRTEFAKLLKQLRKNYPDADLELVRNAYRFANQAHQGQLRLSGDPYISHCIAVARALAQLDLDEITVAAGLLHDVLEDTPHTREEVKKEFGEEIVSLVDGVTKIGAIHMPHGQRSYVEKQAVNLRKMLVATAKDVRVILIKLADRLHNMRTIEHLPAERADPIARETLEIYAPLAHRLGIARWKWELEDHAFHQLHPKEYKELASSVAMKRQEREQWLMTTIHFLEEQLDEAEISARVMGRPKHLYSIWQKMMEQGKSFDQVMDIVAVRIITDTITGCYNALGVIHQLWPPVPGRFKDYVAMPKVNGYQAVHTTVMQEGQPLEIQIRTEEMDRVAREGIAAHWKYKEEGKPNDPKLDRQLDWLRKMFEWLRDAHSPDELLDSVRRDVVSSDLYVFTPKGDVKELQVGSTPLDFAYMVHSDVGHHCIAARVNGNIVPLRYNLQNGDVIEILTSKNQKPHVDWLEIVVTGKARSRIRQRLREIGEMEPLDTQLRKDKVEILPQAKPKFVSVDEKTRLSLVRIQGRKDVAVQFAKCCNAMPGQPILGYVTKTPGITVHRADCRIFGSVERDPTRIVVASWEGDTVFELGLRVEIGQRPNALADITNAIRPMNISITRAQFRQNGAGRGHFDFTFETSDQESLDRVARTLRTVAGVTGVETLRPGH